MIGIEGLEEGLVAYTLLAKGRYSLEFLLLSMSTVNTCQENVHVLVQTVGGSGLHYWLPSIVV